MHNYEQIAGFEHIYLEDSYLLGIEETNTSISFLVEAVLYEDHPNYFSPKPDEQYCYKTGRITFNRIQSVIWLKKKFVPIKDINGTTDLGNIDSFSYSGNQYHIDGEWGEVTILSPQPIIEWLTT